MPDEDEFERLLKFFSLSPEEKEANLKEVFNDAIEYFERFKHLMLHGTPEEKKAAVEKVMTLKKKIDEETKRVCEKTGMTPQQLADYSNNPNNFSPPQWEIIDGAKQKLGKQMEGVQNMMKGEKKGESSDSSNQRKPPRGTGTPPHNWIPM